MAIRSAMRPCIWRSKEEYPADALELLESGVEKEGKRVAKMLSALLFGNFTGNLDEFLNDQRLDIVPANPLGLPLKEKAEEMVHRTILPSP